MLFFAILVYSMNKPDYFDIYTVVIAQNDPEYSVYDWFMRNYEISVNGEVNIKMMIYF